MAGRSERTPYWISQWSSAIDLAAIWNCIAIALRLRPAGLFASEGGVLVMAGEKILTKYRVIPETGTFADHEILMAKKPVYEDLRRLIEPHLSGARLMHVRVLCPTLRDWADMFIDDMGALKRLPRNDAATMIYRNGHLSKNPNDDPEKLPYIAGPAVVFLRPVWER
jgi:hypothetical protein